MEAKEIHRRERSTDKRRKKMVEAAFSCFCSKGIEGTSIADIAREAGLGEATVYRYFENKENIVLECGIRFWTMAFDFMEVWTDTPDFSEKSGMEQVEALIRGAYGFYQQHREAFRMLHNLDAFLLSHQMPPGQLWKYEQAVDRMRPCMYRAIEAGKKDGSISSGTSTQELYYAVTTGILSVMEKMAAAGVLLTSDRIVDSDRKLSLFLELLIAGLKAFYGEGGGS